MRSHSFNNIFNEGTDVCCVKDVIGIEDLPVKFYADLEFDPEKFPENRGREPRVTEMMDAFKQYVESQWKRDAPR